MGCSCQKHARENATDEDTGRTRPLDQCLKCAQKHFDQAYGAWHEFSYERENRRWIRANLRAIIGHTYREYIPVAEKARELSLIIQEYNDNAETDAKFLELGNLIDDMLLDEFPDWQRRIESLNKLAK